jgi:hypothetical protein
MSRAARAASASRPSTQRWGRKPPLVALLAIASGVAGCGAGEAEGDAEGDAEGSERAVWACPTSGDPAYEVEISPRPMYSSTLPAQIDLCLNHDIDRLTLQTQLFAFPQVFGSLGTPATSCITQQVSRVGRHPVDWAVGTVRTFALHYPEALPAGNYEERVTTIVEYSRGGSIPEHSTGGVIMFHPVGEASSTPSSTAPATSENAVVPERCSDVALSAVGNDELPALETITVVDLDGWSRVATVQPLRHDVFDIENERSSSLSFSAWNAAGDYLSVDIEYLPVAGQPFEGQASVFRRGVDRVEWAGLGHVVVVDRGAGELELTLSDVVIYKEPTGDEPTVTRTASGTIVGAVRRQCQAPSWEQQDATWSSAYCAEVRQAAGF